MLKVVELVIKLSFLVSEKLVTNLWGKNWKKICSTRDPASAISGLIYPTFKLFSESNN